MGRDPLAITIAAAASKVNCLYYGFKGNNCLALWIHVLVDTPRVVQQRPEESTAFTSMPGLAGYSHTLRKMAGFEGFCSVSLDGRAAHPIPSA